MIREERIKTLEKLAKIKCPICGMELEDLLEYDTTSEEWEHSYCCSNCLIDISIEEDYC